MKKPREVPMAIQPIDLQTMFTQLDKVGKNQAAQKEGLTVQQALQNVQMQKKTEEHIQSVNEAQDTGEGAEKVDDQSGRKNAGEAGEEVQEHDGGEGDAGEGEEDPVVIRDPALGRNIDISG
jgi:hypothetical protein